MKQRRPKTNWARVCLQQYWEFLLEKKWVPTDLRQSINWTETEAKREEKDSRTGRRPRGEPVILRYGPSQAQVDFIKRAAKEGRFPDWKVKKARGENTLSGLLTMAMMRSKSGGV